jgi:hypothetical protein
MHDRFDDSGKRFSRKSRVAAAAMPTRQDSAARASGYALGFILVFAAAAFVVAHHFLAR